MQAQGYAETRILTQTHTHLQVCPPPPTPHPPRTVFLGPIATVCVTDLISPTICWLEARHRRSYPAWQIQTASVYVCFSQGLTQYGRVESPSWPPNLHPCILPPKDSGAAIGGGEHFRSARTFSGHTVVSKMNKPKMLRGVFFFIRICSSLLKADEQFAGILWDFRFRLALNSSSPLTWVSLSGTPDFCESTPARCLSIN